MLLEPILVTGAVFAVLLWAGLTYYVLHIDHYRTAARSVVSTLLSTLEDDEIRSLPVAE
jgi:hypothetical protein